MTRDEVVEFAWHADHATLRAKILELAEHGDAASLAHFLVADTDTGGLRAALPGLATAALAKIRGPEGIRTAADLVIANAGRTKKIATITGVLGAVWSICRNRLPMMTSPTDLGVQEWHPAVRQSARTALRRIAVEARTQPPVFDALCQFLSMRPMFLATTVEPGEMPEEEQADNLDLHDILFIGTIGLSQSVLNEFERMIISARPEENYQQFLATHPALLDPLASEVIPKQKMGLEHVTDYALRRYDGRYVLVEIEKPGDPIFTQANDFSAPFFHAYGQVLDFQQWVDSHGEYARHLLPGVSSPRGLLVIGRTVELTREGAEKLHRFRVNNPCVDIATYDDLLSAGRTLLRALVRDG